MKTDLDTTVPDNKSFAGTLALWVLAFVLFFLLF